jgi:hypothetical protein
MGNFICVVGERSDQAEIKQRTPRKQRTISKPSKPSKPKTLVFEMMCETVKFPFVTQLNPSAGDASTVLLIMLHHLVTELHQLHEKNIRYGQISADNVTIKNGKASLREFSKRLTLAFSGNIGSPCPMFFYPIEEETLATDIFSLGVYLFYQAVPGKSLFADKHEKPYTTELQESVNATCDERINIDQCPYPIVKELILLMTKKNPADRVTAKDLFDWFTNSK